MRHVVERCPSCGVEHDEAVGGACEACGTALRAWCRRHGRETGWLEGPACPRCAEEAAVRPASPAKGSRRGRPARPSSRRASPSPTPRGGATKAGRRRDRTVHAPPREDRSGRDQDDGELPARRRASARPAVLLVVLCAVVGALLGVIAVIAGTRSTGGATVDILLAGAFGGASAGVAVAMMIFLFIIASIRHE